MGTLKVVTILGICASVYDIWVRDGAFLGKFLTCSV